MQAIYFPKNLLELKKDEVFYIKCNHDEYSLWFDVLKKLPEHSFVSNINQNSLTIESFMNAEVSKVDSERTLGATIVSRNRLAQLNDSVKNDMLVTILKKVHIFNRIFKKNIIKKIFFKFEDPNKSILIFNDDFSCLPLMAAKLGFKQVKQHSFS